MKQILNVTLGLSQNVAETTSTSSVEITLHKRLDKQTKILKIPCSLSSVGSTSIYFTILEEPESVYSFFATVFYV